MELELNNQESTSFLFNIILIPDIKYKLTETNIPSVSIGVIEQFSKVFIGNDRLAFPGDSINYDDLSITFIVDKNMNNYYYIFYWMKTIIDSTNIERINLSNTDPIIQNLIKNEYSDAILFIYTDENISRKIHYKNIFPFSLSEIQFIASDQYKISTCTANFKYENFDFMD